MAIHTNHHDQFFKFFFSKPELAQELFQLIFSKEELKAYNLTKLKAEQNAFSDGSSADLIFSLPLKPKPYQTGKEINPILNPVPLKNQAHLIGEEISTTPVSLSLKEKRKKHSISNVISEIRIFIILEHKASYNVSLFEQLFRYQYLIIEQSLKEGKPLTPIIPVVFYHGKKPWRWKLSFQEALGSKDFLSLPLSFRESMLNFKVRLLDIQDKKWEWVFKDHSFKSRGLLYLLREVWSGELNFKKVFSLFKELLERERNKEGIILNIMEYLIKGYKMKKEECEEAEAEMIKQGLIKKGGYMDIKELFREEGRQEGRQEGQQQGRLEVMINMLKRKMDTKLITEVTGFSEEEIKKLKNRI
ncbi:MAG: Rpn family recombination-promoting nuclease/putative transposase [Bdellovibrionales bacterium]|nr:Rpn family recombination-promoting nuclease/putative transposase [Bdellovibrionales bacterium]